MREIAMSDKSPETGRPDGQPLSGLSLYAGIPLAGKEQAPLPQPAAAPDSNPSPAPAAKTSSSSNSSWSAALRFAPRKSGSSSNKNKPRAAPAIIANSFSSAPAIEDEAGQGEAAKIHAMPGRAKSSVASTSAWSSITPVSQTPVRAASGPSWVQQATSSSALGPAPSSEMEPPSPTARTTSQPPQALLADLQKLPRLVRPPELRLPQAEIDADRAMARAAAVARGESRGSSARRGYEEEWDQDSNWGADEDEDVNGFSMTSAGAKLKKKQRPKKRQPNAPITINWDADYDPRTPNDYAAWKEVVRSRREAVKRVARYAVKEQRFYERRGRSFDSADNDSHYQPEDGSRQRPRYEDDPAATDDRPRVFDEDEDEKPYISPPPTSVPPSPPPPAAAMTGEEAYLRRVAMSQARAQGDDTVAPQLLPPGDSRAPSASSTFMDLAARQSAAAAIAARLAKAAPPTSTSQKPEADEEEEEHRPDPAAFAQRLMAKWGHRSGEGLGTEGNQGRSEALVMDAVKTSSKRSREWDEDGQRVPAPITAARGRFTTEDPRKQEDLEKYGTPSEIVCLYGLLPFELTEVQAALAEDEHFTDDLQSEVSKYGVLSRLAVFPDSLRASHRRAGIVVLVYTGPAGAYQAVRQLDGRWFAGSIVRARYLDRRLFDRGEEAWAPSIGEWVERIAKEE